MVLSTFSVVPCYEKTHADLLLDLNLTSEEKAELSCYRLDVLEFATKALKKNGRVNRLFKYLKTVCEDKKKETVSSMKNQIDAFDNQMSPNIRTPRAETNIKPPEPETPEITKERITSMIENGVFVQYKRSWLNMVPGKLLDIANKQLEEISYTR